MSHTCYCVTPQTTHIQNTCNFHHHEAHMNEWQTIIGTQKRYTVKQALEI